MRSVDVLTDYQLTIAQFYEYNPAVGADCSNLWVDMAYCIRGPGYTPPSTSTALPSSSTTSSASPSSSTAPPATPTPPAPTHPGQPEDCDEWCVFLSYSGTISFSAHSPLIKTKEHTLDD